MGSGTTGREVERMRRNVRRLLRKKELGKILTAAQHGYLNYPKPMKYSAKLGEHRCAFCSNGGHKRGGKPEKSAAGVWVRK